MTLPATPNILVADGELSVREHICESLARESYRCLGVSGCQEALAVAQQLTLDVALLDLAMPLDGGMALARQLRRDNRDLAVVLVTSTRSFDAAIEAMRIGVFDYLLKPITAPELVDVVKRGIEW